MRERTNHADSGQHTSKESNGESEQEKLQVLQDIDDELSKLAELKRQELEQERKWGWNPFW